VPTRPRAPPILPRAGKPGPSQEVRAGADRDHAAATLAQLPPPLRLLYRARWKPRFEKTPRW
jgi:hypothetical protein